MELAWFVNKKKLELFFTKSRVKVPLLPHLTKKKQTKQKIMTKFFFLQNFQYQMFTHLGSSESYCT